MTPFSQENILLNRYINTRSLTERLCAPLEIEDYVPQPMPNVSPPKWHLGHTAWFFETFVLIKYQPTYKIFHTQYSYLFNSYYEEIGARTNRAERGSLSRPTVKEVFDYRAYVDSAMRDLLAKPVSKEVAQTIELGLQHEQQHQELLITDIKYILSVNPLKPVYDHDRKGVLILEDEHNGLCPPLDSWLDIPKQTLKFGHEGSGFAFDNEMPAHEVLISDLQIRHALVTNAEYLVFMNDGGYKRAELWHAEAWDWVRQHSIRSPLYWQQDQSGNWETYTLDGVQKLVSQAPVSHISFYEAFAFCEWAGWRLPTEFEWEAAAPKLTWGSRWEWTQSAYLPYPGFKRRSGAVGEYNGKFMINQHVLRGASYATAPGHARQSYRNFFHASSQWQYTGIRPVQSTKNGNQ